MNGKNFKQMAFYILFLFLLIEKSVLAQLIESVDPTVSQFEIVRGSGDPDYTGALSLKIPLMKVPGRGGLNYNIELSYVNGSGVPAAESASWVGLGWNLNLYQISCSPTYSPDAVSGNEITSDGKDLYHLSYPGGSTAIYQFSDDWRPLDWGAVKIETVDDPNPSQPGWDIQKGFTKFIITDIDGRRYIFSDRLRQESSRPLTNHCFCNPSCSHSHTYQHPYYYVFKLSAILGADYVDSNGDDIPANGASADLGSWIKLEYSTAQTLTLGFSPPYKMEVNYLNKIITPTHTATFNVSSSGNYFIYGGLQNGAQTGILNSISLSPGGIQVDFFTSSQFGWVKQLDGVQGVLVKQAGGSDFLRIGLDSLRISGNSGSEKLPPYKFEYTGNPSENHNTPCGLDPWGYYTLKPFESHPTLADVKWTAWLLKKVTYPAGGTVEYEFETNRYQTYYRNFRGSTGDDEVLAGGVRLKRQTITEPLTQQSTVYDYTYALINKRHPGGYGFLSAEPVIFNNLSLTSQNSVGKNLRTDVHYPDVQIARPDGSKIRKYYTSAFSGVNGKPPGGQSYTAYTNYLYSYYITASVQPDADLQAIQVCSGCSNGIFEVFFWSGTCPDPATDDESFRHFFSDNACYSGSNREQTAFLGEAGEFDDNTQVMYLCSGQVNVALFDNSWKRGRLTCEEFYHAPTGNQTLDDSPIQRKFYSYNMVPIKSEMYKVTATWFAGDGGCANGGTNWKPAFLTSGWAQLAYAQTTIRRDPNSTTLSLLNAETYEYNTTNGLIKKLTEANSDNTQRLTKFKYPVDYTNTTGAGDVYEQALHAMRTTKHIYSPVIEKEIREWSSGQSEKLVAAELVKYKQFGTSAQYFPHEIKKFLNPTAVTDFTESNITGGVFTADSRYQLQATNDYDAHGNPILVYDAGNPSTPTGAIWAYNNTLPIAQIRNATPTNAMVSIFDDGNASGWANGLGTWAVYNGAYLQTDNSVNSITLPQRFNNLSLDNAVFEADVRFDLVTTPQRLAICKYIDGNNVVRFVLRREVSNPVVRIYAQKGATTKIVDAPRLLNAMQWFHLRGEIQDSTAKLYLDGELLLTVTHSTIDHGLGKIGLGTELSQASFDNVRFYPLNALAVSQSFDPGFFTVNTRTEENGMSRRFTFDALGRLKTVQDALGNLVQNTAYYYSSPFSTSNPNYLKTTLATNAALHLRNHDFENGVGSTPDFWSTLGTSGSGQATWDNTVSSSGKKSLKAYIPSPGSSDRVLWNSFYYDEKVSPKETYRMEVWAKTANGYNGNAKFILWFHNAAHGFTESDTIPIPSGDREWTKYTRDFTPLATTDHLYTIHLDFSSNNQYKGTVWFDRANFYELNTTKTFADGLGRSVQTAQYLGSNSSVQAATIYDNLSRVSKTTKPFLSADTLFTKAYDAGAAEKYPPIDSANAWYSSGAQKHPAYFEGSWSDPTKYDTAPYAFSQTAYYNDPLDRVQKQAAPGTAFYMGSGREVKFHYFGNADADGLAYSANTLLKQRRTDENGNAVSTFTDNFGNTVATIVDSGGLIFRTTFKYDVMGNLLASRAPRATTTGDSTKYFYTTLNQLRKKISPDAGRTEYLYDPNGNLRLVKDANGIANNSFIYYKYDSFNRKIEEGTAGDTTRFIQNNANTAAFPTTNYAVKIIYQYDGTGSLSLAGQRNLRGRLSAMQYASPRFTSRQGYLYYSYDNNGRVEWIEQRLPKSNTDDSNGTLIVRINYEYDAPGKITKTYYRRIFPTGISGDAFYTWYDYDALGRLEKVFTNVADVKIDSIAAQYTYWPSGQVRRLVLGNNLQGVDYLYNSRDWLTQINHQNLYYTQDPGADGGGASALKPDRFGQVIGYDQQKQIASGSADFIAQYNGNISWTIHNTYTNIYPVSPGITGWVFKYDQANRLKKANWGHWGGSAWVKSWRYDLTGPTSPDSLIEYDANGNLKKMIRYNENNAATGMTYNYTANTNRLHQVLGLNGQSANNYTYDANGNMTKDIVKLGSANTISYDYRNLPYKAPTASGTVDFDYDGNGRRISKNTLVYVPGADGKTLAVYNDQGTLLYWNIWGLDLIGQQFWKQ